MRKLGRLNGRSERQDAYYMHPSEACCLFSLREKDRMKGANCNLFEES